MSPLRKTKWLVGIEREIVMNYTNSTGHLKFNFYKIAIRNTIRNLENLHSKYSRYFKLLI